MSGYTAATLIADLADCAASGCYFEIDYEDCKTLLAEIRRLQEHHSCKCAKVIGFDASKECTCK